MEQLDMFASLEAAQKSDSPDPRQEYLDLVKTLNYHAERYYAQDEPEISDYEYDQMNNRLKAIEKEHPDWIVPDSPSRRVGWKAEKGVLVKHNVPMLSLQDVFSREEVDEFCKDGFYPMKINDKFMKESIGTIDFSDYSNPHFIIHNLEALPKDFISVPQVYICGHMKNNNTALIITGYVFLGLFMVTIAVIIYGLSLIDEF